MITDKSWIHNFITLIVILDPPGLVPLFLGLTLGMNNNERNQTAIIASIVAFGILSLFAILGMRILTILGISLEAFRIAGGILLFFIAFEMIFEDIDKKEKNKLNNNYINNNYIKSIAIFPLALPLIAGPGTISATLLISSKQSNNIDIIILLFMLFASIFICYIFMLLSIIIDKLIGNTGRTIFTRLFGVLLAALSVQFISDSLKKTFF